MYDGLVSNKLAIQAYLQHQRFPSQLEKTMGLSVEVSHGCVSSLQLDIYPLTKFSYTLNLSMCQLG